MKFLISVLLGELLISVPCFSKNNSKVQEYINESKDDSFVLSAKDINDKKVPDVSFSLDGKRNVDQEFLKDDFVRSIIDDKNQKFSIKNDGDMEFESVDEQKPAYDESVKLKDEGEYSADEMAQFAKTANQYYKFKDFDDYNNYYYYYDKNELEKYKESETASISDKAASIGRYMAFLGSSLFNSQTFFYVRNNYSADQALRYNIAKAAGANMSLINEAVGYYNSNSGKFSNKRFMAVLEFSKHSSKSRFYIINLSSGKVVAAYHVSHGSGSDTNNDGYATYFSNVPNSRTSSIGIYRTGGIYNGKYGKSLKLYGLSSTNSNVYSRAIVMHPSPYVREANVKEGRSWGCMAFDYRVSGDVINMLRGGSMIYAKYVR
jgi:hypothetical protein